MYQPMPRKRHTSAQVANKVIVCSGRTEDRSVENRKRLGSIVEVYHPQSEHWEAKQCTGQTPAPGLYGAASAVVNDQLYSYGGVDGDDNLLHSLLHLNTKTYEWRELNAQGAALPMRKLGSAMVACEDGLALFGGFGKPRGSTQRGSSFIKGTGWFDGRGWTNEFHIYHLNEGMHTCTTMNRICSLGIHYPSSSQHCWLWIFAVGGFPKGIVLVFVVDQPEFPPNHSPRLMKHVCDYICVYSRGTSPHPVYILILLRST